MSSNNTHGGSSRIYVVEHLDPELEDWSALEYKTIAHETAAAGSQFLLTSLSESLKLPEGLASIEALKTESKSVEEIFEHEKARVCLLDPGSTQDLSPADGKNFDVFLFGGILGNDPPQDRTSVLRHKGFVGRRLGAIQMTTDTAVRVTRMVVEEKFSLDKIPYTDFPELKINKHESTQMPFRYVKDSSGKPVMPEGMFELIQKDSEKSFEDLF